MAETVGLWYLSGLLTLYEGGLSVFARRFKVTRAFNIGARPVITGSILSNVACASDNSEDKGVFLRRVVFNWEACQSTWRPVATGLRFGAMGILSCGGYLTVEEETYGLCSASLLWGSNLMVEPFPAIFEVKGSDPVGVLK